MKMSGYCSFTIFPACLVLAFFYGCNQGAETGNGEGTHTRELGEQAGHEHSEEAGERIQEAAAGHTHDEGGEHSHEHGEESGRRFPLDGTYDDTWRGVRLILVYDSEASAFVGTMENVTKEALSTVSIEIHLSNGVELGPTQPVDLAPAQKVEVRSATARQDFDWWKTHPETGGSEH